MQRGRLRSCKRSFLLILVAVIVSGISQFEWFLDLKPQRLITALSLSTHLLRFNPDPLRCSELKRSENSKSLLLFAQVPKFLLSLFEHDFFFQLLSLLFWHSLHHLLHILSDDSTLFYLTLSHRACETLFLKHFFLQTLFFLLFADFLVEDLLLTLVLQESLLFLLYAFDLDFERRFRMPQVLGGRDVSEILLHTCVIGACKAYWVLERSVVLWLTIWNLMEQMWLLKAYVCITGLWEVRSLHHQGIVHIAWRGRHQIAVSSNWGERKV